MDDRWVEQLRRGPLAGPEFEDVAQQCADDAVVSILGKLDEFRGLSRFTTWAYKFVSFEVSSKLARHAWQRHPSGPEELTFDHLPDALAVSPGEHAERREQLAALTGANEPTATPSTKNLFDARRKLRACLAEAGYPLRDEELAA